MKNCRNKSPAKSLRFFSPLKELSPTLTARLTQIDYAREMAFIATRPLPNDGEETLGAVRASVGDAKESVAKAIKRS